MLYNNLSTYLKSRYGKNIRKICIDGGFTCPNRDGKCGTGGCIFCGERGAGEHISPSLSIRSQVDEALKSAKENDIFIAYFQNFTNTYAEIEVLRERYDSALIDERIKILAVGTRPDCIDEAVCELLSGYNEKYEVWVELGLQTANDRTAAIVNRGYTRNVFEKAVNLLTKYKIKVVVHLMLGLPEETKTDAIASAEFLSRFDIFGVKIHSLYVMENTRLAEICRKNRYTPPTLSEYADMASEVLARLSPEVIVHRITGDCPRDMLVAPEWNKDKNAIIDAVNSEMKRKGYTQGVHFKKE